MHNIPDFLRVTPEMQEQFAKGGMIKRADGSYSRRGLWDNIRANKGSGRKPTKEMLEQEAKIRAQEQYGGLVDEYGNGGYTVRRSNARKGKTHVVIGPDGTKKYFGDPNMGERGKSKHGKEAFYARHAKNLKNNPYFRAYARATWEDGGEVPKYQDGTTSVNLAEVKISPKQYQELSADELRALHNKVGKPEGNSNSYGTIPKLIKDSIRDINAIKRLKKVTQNYNNSDIIVEPTTQYEGTDGHYYPLTPREAEQYNQYESNLPWYKNLWYNIATKDIPEGSRLANYPERNEAYLNNFPYVYQDYQGQDYVNQNYENQDTLQTPVVYKGTTYTTPFIVNPEEESNIYYTDGSHANPNRPLTNNSTQVDPKWIAKMQQQGFKNGGSYGPFYGRRDAAKMQRMFTPSADSMTPYFDMGGPFKNFEEEPTTGNSGQGINSTDPATSPAVANTGQPFGMMAPQPTQAPSPLTNQSLTNYLESNTPEASAIRQNTEDYNYQQAMQKDFGKSMDEVDMAYKDLATAHPNYTNQELLKTLRTNYQDELNKKNTDLKNQSMKAEQARMKSIAGTLHGVDKMGQATMAGLDLFSRMNPNSYQNAVLNKNRENANPMNTMNIVGNRKGIEYSAYGGYTGLKEGVELNLSTQQIHELEKQGYKFQIL